MASVLTDTDALREFVQCEVGQPFAWGRTDCVSLVLRGLAAMGTPAPSVCWGSRREALQVYRATGGPVQFFREAGWTRASVSHAVTGDLVVVPRVNAVDGFPGFGLAYKRGYLSSSLERGVHLTPLARAGGLAYVLKVPS